MRIHYLLHAAFETPGIIGEWARARGHAFDGTLTPAEGRLPEAGDVDFLVIMGGPQSATRLGDYPYLRDEMALIERVIGSGRPVLGICLGAQLIAEVLGAHARRSPEKEVGFFPVRLTAAGRKDPLFAPFPEEFLCLHWHHDMPGIPAGATLLAESDGCPHQAFRYGERVYGLQFHLEPTRETAPLLIENGASDLRAGKYTQTAESILAGDFETMNRRLMQALDTLAALPEAPAGPR
jgi:GMP synthase (glutamine-hydrolysing)